MTKDTLCLNCLEPSSTQPCPECGWSSGDEPDNPSALPPGTLLNKRFRLAKSLGQGGFGITYLAFDETLEIRLAVKEYLPQDFAQRSHDAQAVVPKSKNEENFNFGLERFVKEARMLARFIDHPGIVGVRDFFKENSTAYLVMDYLEGRSLKEYLAENEGQLPWDEAVGIMIPVLDALRAVHQEIDTDGEPMLHRDIAPDNIYITKDSRVELLDFGAARYASGELSRSLSVVLKEGYAPEEQYRRKGKQGPWTDVYSCGATLYRMITGELPDNALDRLEDDELRTPSELGIEIPHESEEALMLAEEHAGQIDMMISDVIMPGLDGPSLLKKARKYLGDAPVMFISGYAESDFSDLLQDEAGGSFLPKPLDIKTLAERVKQELHAG